jgi:hypothetical protein
MRDARLRRLCLGVIALLYVASVPWYREPGAEPAIWLGLPDWVALSVLCYVGVALFNSLAWMSTEVPEVEPEAVEDDREAAS